MDRVKISGGSQVNKESIDDCLNFEVIDDYRPTCEKDLREIIKLLQESKNRLEKENEELKEHLAEKTRTLDEVKQIQIKLQEEIIHLKAENNAFKHHTHTHGLTEEKLKAMLDETSVGLFDKLDENFKQHLKFVRERNINIRGGDPFPFTPERMVTPLLTHPWLLNFPIQKKDLEKK